MRLTSLAATAFVLTTALGGSPAQASPTIELRRFALVIGANDGGADRTRLRYARSDARQFARVVDELGGVADGDAVLLLDPSGVEIDRGFDRMQAKLEAARSPRVRVELLIYYSGHSDENGVLLAGKRYGYQRLRHKIGQMPADVKIAILDSCASGAFTRTKGGVRRPAFVVDQSSRVQGHAFLSSSSADEAAQESDRIGASVFTHYLVSGLRGGADNNFDQRVTLSEAYQFAFSETVARTATTKHGAQHPAYDMHLIGTGDVVMTDLRATTAALELAGALTGRLFIRDSAGRLVLEMRKAPGAPVVLGLGPERYQVILERGRRRFQAVIDLRGGGRVTLDRGQFTVMAVEDTVARGAPGEFIDDPPVASAEHPTVGARFTLVPHLSTSRGPSTDAFALNLLIGAGTRLYGAEVAGLVNVRTDRASGGQVAGVANWNAGDGNVVQVGGVVNWNGGDLGGAQFAGVVNANRGNLDGGQFAGVVNTSGGVGEGAQFAGVANWNRGSLRGVQGAGVTNWSGGHVSGAQLAGVANVAQGDVSGLQGSGLANYAAGHIRGMQLGVINVGSVVHGLQLGVVNIASRVEGVQLGVINVANRADGTPIGLASFVRHGGYRSLEVWTSDMASLTAGFKLGSDRLYTLFAAGSTADRALFGLGIGAHVPRQSYYFDVDLAGYTIFDHEFAETPNDGMAQLRAMVGIPVLGELSLFGGVSMTALVALDGKPGEALTPLEAKTYQYDTVQVRLSPGLFGGVAY